MKVRPMDQADIAELRIGSIIRNRGSGDAMVVVSRRSGSMTAIRATEVTNPDEWLVIEPVTQ
ncbi:hypothetical protein HHL26_06640 [Sphingobium sp. TB-6]|uniref:hypothetical protein n=1 Tax=Sphingobium sp. TB-6 TaxID=2728850 RepID=UPI00146BDDB5|nr:hypothetical protein [Sphingobium sp. TB-6]NML88744.1 hypothetical protein [Sphingobium sp. TB-6]